MTLLMLAVVLIACATSNPIENDSTLISSGRRTKQSSTGWNGDSSRGVDGNTDGNYFRNSCTHSQFNFNNWWTAYFDSNYAVSKVVVYNRQDCCQDRINGAMVYVGAEYCGTIKYESGKVIYSINCNNGVGGAVTIKQPYNYLTLCEVKVYGKKSEKNPLTNIALNKKTSQSTTGYGGHSERAVDGRVQGVYHRQSCTHTLNRGLQWWMVNLEQDHYVNKVVIYNRADCCSARLNGAKVLVDDQECGVITTVSGKQAYVVNCDKTGSSVKVQLSNQYLTLCEVEVLGDRTKNEEDDYTNIAPDGRAAQDSTGWNGAPERATDGNRDGNYWGKSCSYNGDLRDGWWNLAFQSKKLIDHVIIWNRDDCCSERINGVKVYVDNQLCDTIQYEEGVREYKVDCGTEGFVGKNVYIKAAPGQYLTLCEVEVMSDPKKSADGLVNLALHKPTAQSSTWAGTAISDRAVDGNTNPNHAGLSCSHTIGSGWWTVDLQNLYRIKKIVITNRMDCCSNRIDRVLVYAGPVFCGAISYKPRQIEYELECDAVTSEVKIVNFLTHLQLCEVEVYGLADPIKDDDDDNFIDGNESGIGDDKQSIVKCPAGSTIKSCTLVKGNVPDSTDGILVKPGQCSAFNGARGMGTTARAVCTPATTEDNPCNGPQLNNIVYVTPETRTKTPSVECPPGYDMSSCLFHSYWSHVSLDAAQGKVSHDSHVTPDNGVCSLPKCSTLDKAFCTLTAICQLVSPDEYAKSKCSTCDGYNCGEEEKCEMVEGKPTCTIKQTGCDDNNKCGSYGECKPVGTSDYTCVCDDGYKLFEDEDKEVKTCISRNTVWEVVEGDIVTDSDARSTAECPDDTKVMRCMTYGMPTASDGVSIENDGLSCVAQSSRTYEHTIQAIAYCGPVSTMKNPCNGFEIGSYEHRFITSATPVLRCPKGYVMESCNILHPWAEYLTGDILELFDSIGSVHINDEGFCSIPNCAVEGKPDSFCRLSAVCQKLTGDEYVKEACPTCEQMTCDDDEECTIGDNGLPQCTEIIEGGCDDKDKCGMGKCKVVNVTDFTCVCSKGYEFDGATCVDVNECEEDPCGNGECNNEAGSYSCKCLDGYEFKRGRCQDIDECKEDRCHSATTKCNNVEGGFECDCRKGLVKVNQTSCGCAKGYVLNGKKCEDVNECEENVCKDNEKCRNTKGGYECKCEDGFVRGDDGVCKEDVKWTKCQMKTKKDHIEAILDQKVTVWLYGIKQKDFRDHGTIRWLKDGKEYDPDIDGKDVTVKGFEIQSIKAEDAGMYVAQVTYVDGNDRQKCQASLEISIKEGSTVVKIKNRKDVSKDQKSGKSFVIICDLELVNVDIEKPNDPNNVDWYKIVPGQLPIKITEETHGDQFGFIKKRGDYRLRFVSPTPNDSGTYRCQFEKDNIETSTDVTVNVV